MPPYIKRGIITFWVVLAIGTVMFFVNKFDNPILRLVIVCGGFGFIFIFVKSYLFRL
jgi:hypothetical protein